MNAIELATRLAQELANLGTEARLGATQGIHGHKVALANGNGNIVVYVGRKGPSYVINEVRNLSPTLAECVKLAWTAAQGLGVDQQDATEQLAQTSQVVSQSVPLREYAMALAVLARRCSELECPVDWPPIFDAINKLAETTGKAASLTPSDWSSDFLEEWIALAEAIAVELEPRTQSSG